MINKNKTIITQAYKLTPESKYLHLTDVLHDVRTKESRSKKYLNPRLAYRVRENFARFVSPREYIQMGYWNLAITEAFYKKRKIPDLKFLLP